ncbi:MAG: PaaI family thioesterase [Rhodobacteraceae bacterium]|nr:PaaI family thioesterase [Paracoccaceae bacterium]
MTPSQATELLKTHFAPWVGEMNLQAVAFDPEGGDFTLPDSPALCRPVPDGGTILCGQAVMAAADTCSVLVLLAMAGRMRALTTVDLTTHFLRPLPRGPVDIRVQVLASGRRMATTRVEFRSAGSVRLAASAQCGFAYLEP